MSVSGQENSMGGRGEKEKGEGHGQSMECKQEGCRGLILGEDRRLDFSLGSTGSHRSV